MAEQTRARAVKSVRPANTRAVKTVTGGKPSLKAVKTSKPPQTVKTVKVISPPRPRADADPLRALRVSPANTKAVKTVTGSKVGKGGKPILKAVKTSKPPQTIKTVKAVSSVAPRADADPLRALQQRLDYRFNDERLLARALTHRSFSADHNERLEFLGDAVLGLAVSHRLFAALQKQPEGDLSRARAQLVRETALHALALRLGLPGALRLGEGEARTGGRQRASILADALEAVIGAVYLDGGAAAADALVGRLLQDTAITPGMAATARDPKTALQEWLQGRHLALPRYEVAAITGAEHRQTFDVCCAVDALGQQTRGQGASRRAAEQSAAAAMLARLEHH